LPEELLAGGGKLSGPIFHFYAMKDITVEPGRQEKNNKIFKTCFKPSAAFPNGGRGSDQGDAGLQEVQNSSLDESSRLPSVLVYL
jgi:hypothetical protein